MDAGHWLARHAVSAEHAIAEKYHQSRGAKGLGWAGDEEQRRQLEAGAAAAPESEPEPEPDAEVQALTAPAPAPAAGA